MERNQKIILGVLLAVVVLGSAAYVLLSKKQPATTTPTKTAPIVQNFKKTDAPVGQITSGFPRELILDPNSATKQSYSIKYDNSNQYTADFKSSLMPADLYKLYNDYLTANGYTIVNQNNTPTFGSVYATKDTSIVNAVFSRIDKATTTTATITYVK